MKRFLLITLTLALGFPARPGSALDPSKAATQYQLDSWGTRDALPAHTIADIAQSGDGYMWFATRGLVRFDGVSFTNVPLPGTKGLAPQILSLAEAPDGGLWILAQSLGLFHYKNGTLAAARRRNGVGFIQAGRNGDVWLVPGDEVLHFRNGQADRLMRVIQARALLEDEDGTLWIAAWDAAEGGLLRVRGEEVTRYGADHGLDTFVSSLARGRDGTLWLGTRKGLTAFRDGRFTTYTTRDGLPDDFVTTLLEDRDGNLWIGTSGGGLSRRTGNKFSTLRQADGLVDDQVAALHEDDEGGIWVAGRGGVGRLRDTSFTTYTKREGMPVEAFMEAHPAKAGGIWVSTYGGGLGRLSDGRLTLYDARAGVASPYVGTVYEASDGTVWFGDGSNQLSRLRNGRVESFDTGKRYVWAITEDAEGIVVGLPRQGLFRLRGGRLEPYRTSAGETLTEPILRVLLRGRDGALWVGGSRGLARVSPDGFTIYAKSEGLTGTVFSLHEDDGGTLWIATSMGLARLKDGAIQRFDGQAFLSDNSIVTLLDDGEGHLWFNSIKGLGRVAKSDLDAYLKSGAAPPVRIFTAQDGLKIEEVRTTPTVQRACRSSDGRLWFPTLRGLSVVDPRRLVRDEKAPPLLIEQVVVDGTPLPRGDTYQVAPGAEKVEIRYTALSYTRPERVTFRYQLEGFDQGWVEAGARRSAYYTKLPPGRFRFRVRATNSDGVSNETGAAVPLAQEPRYYQTMWFRALLVLTGGLAVLSLHRFRVRQLKARERELQVRVEEALAQVKTLHGLLPICASCKKIRDDSGYWNLMETYIHEHSAAEFSHSICPECMIKLYPDYVGQQAG